MVLAFPPGVNWLIAYWLVVNVIGAAFNVANLRSAIRQVRRVRTDERPLRSSALGHLALQVMVGGFTAIALTVGVLGLSVALRSGMTLAFDSTVSGVVAIVVILGLGTGPALQASLTWGLRRRTLRRLWEEEA